MYVYQFLTWNSNFKTTSNLQNSYFHKVHLSFEKNYSRRNVGWWAERFVIAWNVNEIFALKPWYPAKIRPSGVPPTSVSTGHRHLFTWSHGLKICHVLTSHQFSSHCQTGSANQIIGLLQARELGFYIWYFIFLWSSDNQITTRETCYRRLKNVMGKLHVLWQQVNGSKLTKKVPALSLQNIALVNCQSTKQRMKDHWIHTCNGIAKTLKKPIGLKRDLFEVSCFCISIRTRNIFKCVQPYAAMKVIHIWLHLSLASVFMVDSSFIFHSDRKWLLWKEATTKLWQSTLTSRISVFTLLLLTAAVSHSLIQWVYKFYRLWVF